MAASVSCRNSSSKTLSLLLVIQVILTCLYVSVKISDNIFGSISPLPTQISIRPAQKVVSQLSYIVNYTDQDISRHNETNSKESGYDVTNNYYVDRVRQFCEGNKTKINIFAGSIFNFGLPTYVWMASEKHHLFYCAIPKSSSTTWKNYLMEDNNYKWKGDLHTAATRLGVEWVAARLNQTRQFTKFLQEYRPSNRLMIVRNPWARLVSAYRDKLVRSKWSLGHLCVAAGKYPKQKNVTFERFVDCIANSNTRVMWNSHVHPFSSLCALCHMDYNIIAKMKELDQAEPLIFKRLNLTKSELKYKPPAKGMYSNTYSTYYSNVTAQQVEALRNIYRIDIELFNYPNTPYE